MNTDYLYSLFNEGRFTNNANATAIAPRGLKGVTGAFFALI